MTEFDAVDCVLLIDPPHNLARVLNAMDKAIQCKYFFHGTHRMHNSIVFTGSVGGTEDRIVNINLCPVAADSGREGMLMTFLNTLWVMMMRDDNLFPSKGNWPLTAMLPLKSCSWLYFLN